MTTTPQQIEDRDFSFAQAFYRDPHQCRVFIVGTPHKQAAKARALHFATQHWGEPYKIIVYPRTYVRDARKLLAAGQAD